MITVEEKLKNLILSQYQSFREFTSYAGIANTTFDSMMRRGIRNSNVTSVIKVCNALHISADALAEGKIISVAIADDEIITPPTLPIEKAIKDFKSYLLCDNLTLDGKTLDREIINEFNNFLDLGLELIRRHTK